MIYLIRLTYNLEITLYLSDRTVNSNAIQALFVCFKLT
jgi:hypothetical protein